MNDERRQESCEVELAKEGVAGAGPTDEAARCEQIHRVPEAVVSDQTEDGCGDDHRNAAGDASSDAGGDSERFYRKNLAWRHTFVNSMWTLHQGSDAGDFDC